MQFTQGIVFVLVACSSAMGPGVIYQNSSHAVSARSESVQKLEVFQRAIRENDTGLVTSHLASHLASGMSLHFVAKARLDINQKVYIEGQPTLGDGAGQGSLNKCRSFAPQHVDSPDAPHVKVCGNGIKMTAYLLGACKGYYKHSRIVGTCQSSMPPDTCDSFGPAQDASFGAYQSYKIEQC